MKNVILAFAMLALGAQAKADGFVCQTNDGALNIRAFNKTQPEKGTRNAAVIVVSDATVAYGNKTIARFDADNTAKNSGALYTGKVDLRYNDSSRKGELIGGTKLGELKIIKLGVDFSYAAPVEESAELDATLILIKRDGDVIELPTTCARYLKGE